MLWVILIVLFVLGAAALFTVRRRRV